MKTGFSCYLLDPTEVANQMGDAAQILEISIPKGKLKEAKALKSEVLEPAGIEPVMTVMSLPDGVMFDSEHEMETWENGLPYLKELGVKRLRTVGGARGQDDGSFVERVLSQLKGIMPWVEDNGVTLSYENHGEPVEEVLAIIEGVGSDNFKILLDPLNAHLANQDPVDVTRQLLPHTEYIHVKDVEFNEDGPVSPQSCCPLLQGGADWEPLLPLIKGAERDFDVVFELPGYKGDMFGGYKQGLALFSLWYIA